MSTKRTAKRSTTTNSVALSLIDRLHRDVARESVVVFTGGGSTTERGGFGRYSFYEAVKKEGEYPKDSPAPSFPSLMKYFCDTVDGGHHNRLINLAITYLEEYLLPGELNDSATGTPNLIAEIPYLKKFVTTNWDPFLERALDVLVPVIEDRDLAFWDGRKKQVLKIHGCITRPYSIVATESDYTECLTAHPLIFNKLRDLMATQTFLFLGYSMRDSDFREIWDSITSSLGRFAKLAYAVDPKASDEDVEYWRQRGILIYKTSDQEVLKSLRERLEAEDLIPTQEFIEYLREERKRLVPIHLEMSQNSDGGMASAMYQDGLLHALSDVVMSSFLGSKRNQDFEAQAANAGRRIRSAKKEQDPIEVAYWSGHREVIRRFCERDDTKIPAYFHPYRFEPIRKFVRGRLW